MAPRRPFSVLFSAKLYTQQDDSWNIDPSWEARTTGRESTEGYVCAVVVYMSDSIEQDTITIG